MISATVKIEDKMQRVEKAAEKAAYKNFNHAAASISKDVKSSLETAEGPSAPGSPPHTHRGAFLRRAVRYAANKDGAVIGPMASVVDEAGALHEFGGEREGDQFPERPFMAPALERAVPRLAGIWRGTIGE